MLQYKFVKFLITGSINTIFYYILFSIYIYIGFNYKLAVLLATLFGVFFSFKSFGKYVFENTNRKLIYKFSLVYIILYFINILIINLSNIVIDNYYISGLIATLFCAVLSFVLNNIFVFRRNEK